MKDRPIWYKLDGHRPVPATLNEVGALFEKPEARRVAWTDMGGVDGDVVVSTVFLVIDHSIPMRGAPVLFETMVFGGPLDQEQERYSTWEEAEAGHARWVEKAREAQHE